jgi:F5/8 type C domain
MTAHRYWRIMMNASAGNAFSLAEIQFRTVAGVSRPFSGGTASAYNSYPGYPPAQATDGDNATFWSSSDATPGDWKYDYGVGNAIDVVEIMITSRNDSFYTQTPTSFTLQWSDDGSTWTSMMPISASWSSPTQTQAFAVTPLAGTAAILTQIALEQWNANNPTGQMTQIALEQWASVAGAGFFSARHV